MEEFPTPEVPAPTPVPAPTGNRQGLAIASLVLGIVNLCAWLLPICGGPLALVGIVLGILGLNSSRRGMAIAGIVISGIALLLVILNAVLGVVLAPQIQQLMNSAGY